MQNGQSTLSLSQHQATDDADKKKGQRDEIRSILLYSYSSAVTTYFTKGDDNDSATLLSSEVGNPTMYLILIPGSFSFDGLGVTR
jgi:hypothetical protein